MMAEDPLMQTFRDAAADMARLPSWALPVITPPQEAPMSNPGPARQFQQVHIAIDVWVDPETSSTDAWAVADNVQISAYKAVEAAMKEIEAPDNGVEVVVR